MGSKGLGCDEINKNSFHNNETSIIIDEVEINRSVI